MKTLSLPAFERAVQMLIQCLTAGRKSNAACEATEKALRVAGGFSLTKELPLERYFRDARAGLFQPPQDDLALGQIGRAALARIDAG